VSGWDAVYGNLQGFMSQPFIGEENQIASIGDQYIATPLTPMLECNIPRYGFLLHTLENSVLFSGGTVMLLCITNCIICDKRYFLFHDDIS